MTWRSMRRSQAPSLKHTTLGYKPAGSANLNKLARHCIWRNSAQCCDKEVATPCSSRLPLWPYTLRCHPSVSAKYFTVTKCFVITFIRNIIIQLDLVRGHPFCTKRTTAVNFPFSANYVAGPFDVFRRLDLFIYPWPHRNCTVYVYIYIDSGYAFINSLPSVSASFYFYARWQTGNSTEYTYIH